MTDDEKMATEQFSVGSLAHELASVIDALLAKQGAPLESVFDSVVCSQMALMNLVMAQMEWRNKRDRKRDINERLVQIRH